MHRRGFIVRGTTVFLRQGGLETILECSSQLVNSQSVGMLFSRLVEVFQYPSHSVEICFSLLMEMFQCFSQLVEMFQSSSQLVEMFQCFSQLAEMFLCFRRLMEMFKCFNRLSLAAKKCY